MGCSLVKHSLCRFLISQEFVEPLLISISDLARMGADLDLQNGFYQLQCSPLASWFGVEDAWHVSDWGRV